MITPEAQRKGAATNRKKALERDALVLKRLDEGWQEVNGLAIWTNADRSMREWLIDEACNADQGATAPRRIGGGLASWPQARERITIAQALEVLKK